MKNSMLGRCLVSFGLLLLSVCSFANDIKIGVVDLQRVIAEAAEVKAIKTELETQFSPKRAALVERQRLIKADMNKYERDGSVMTDVQKKELQEKITSARNSFEQEGRAYEQALNKAQNEAMEKFFTKVRATLDDLAKADHYDLILQKDAVPFTINSLDVTAKLLAKLG